MCNFSLSGCLNGGGQIKPRTGQSTKDLIQQLEILYMQDVSSLVNIFYDFERCTIFIMI